MRSSAWCWALLLLCASASLDVCSTGEGAGATALGTMDCVVARDGRCVLERRAVPVPRGREVLVKVLGTALNRADTLQRRGSYPPPPGASDILGLELAGEVVAQGPEAERRWAPGSQVMALLSGGGYAQYCTVDERLLMPFPKGFSAEEGAAIPETWLTAFQLLWLVGELQPPDVVLVHAAGSGVGIAAIQLAIGLGARVIAVAGTDDKLRHAKKLGAFATVNYKTAPKFSEAVLQATQGRGASLILDPVGGGSHMAENLEAIAADGRWVLYGLMGGVEPSKELLGTILKKRIQIRGTTLRARRIEYKADLVAAFSAHALPRFESGAYVVQVDRTFNGLEQADKAHELMESNATLGKLVLQVSGHEPLGVSKL